MDQPSVSVVKLRNVSSVLTPRLDCWPTWRWRENVGSSAPTTQTAATTPGTTGPRACWPTPVSSSPAASWETLSAPPVTQLQCPAVARYLLLLLKVSSYLVVVGRPRIPLVTLWRSSYPPQASSVSSPPCLQNRGLTTVWRGWQFAAVTQPTGPASLSGTAPGRTRPLCCRPGLITPAGTPALEWSCSVGGIATAPSPRREYNRTEPQLQALTWNISQRNNQCKLYFLPLTCLVQTLLCNQPRPLRLTNWRPVRQPDPGSGVLRARLPQGPSSSATAQVPTWLQLLS